MSDELPKVIKYQHHDGTEVYVRQDLRDKHRAVSYTHLTLPTILLV